MSVSVTELNVVQLLAAIPSSPGYPSFVQNIFNDFDSVASSQFVTELLQAFAVYDPNSQVWQNFVQNIINGGGGGNLNIDQIVTALSVYNIALPNWQAFVVHIVNTPQFITALENDAAFVNWLAQFIQAHDLTIQEVVTAFETATDVLYPGWNNFMANIGGNNAFATALENNTAYAMWLQTFVQAHSLSIQQVILTFETANNITYPGWDNFMANIANNANFLTTLEGNASYQTWLQSFITVHGLSIQQVVTAFETANNITYPGWNTFMANIAGNANFLATLEGTASFMQAIANSSSFLTALEGNANYQTWLQSFIAANSLTIQQVVTAFETANNITYPGWDTFMANVANNSHFLTTLEGNAAFMQAIANSSSFLTALEGNASYQTWLQSFIAAHSLTIQQVVTAFETANNITYPGWNAFMQNISTSLYGTASVLTTAPPSTINAIPVFSNTSGAVDTLATTTPATLARPMSLTAGATDTAATLRGSNLLCNLLIGTTNLGSNRGSVIFGRNNTWEVGSDSGDNNTDDFFILRSGAPCLRISSTGQLIEAVYGFTGFRYDVAAPGTINPGPGSLGTLWRSSADTGHLRLDANTLANQADLKTNTNVLAKTLVAYADTSANLMGTSSGNGPFTTGDLQAPSYALSNPGYVTNPQPTMAGCMWMKVSTDPDRPQWMSGGSMALLSDINGTKSTSSVNIGTPAGFTTVTGNTFSLSRVGQIIRVTGAASLVLTNGNGGPKNNAVFLFSWPVGFAPSQSSTAGLGVSLDSGVTYDIATLVITTNGITLVLPSDLNVQSNRQIDTRTGVFFTYVS